MKHWVCVSLLVLPMTGCAWIALQQGATQMAPPRTVPFASLRPVEITVTGSDVALTGFLYRPASPGAHPAMLHLHGCGGFRNAAGMPNESYRLWAVHWQQLGFVVLILDSFTPRGEKEICTQNFRKIRVDVERVRDAYAGLSYLAGLTDVDPGRIVIQGWSHGGSTALNALQPNAPGRRPDGPQFRAAVSYYPGCVQPLRGKWSPNVPLLIQAGGADDWTPARYCEQLSEKVRAGGAAVEIDVYPDAHHGFDRLRQPVRLLPNVGAGRKGAHIGTHPEAREKALRRTTEWVLSQVR